MLTLIDIIDGMKKSIRPSSFWKKNTFCELETSRYVRQRNCQTVFDHTMRALDRLQDKNDVTLLSILFHDLGKNNIVMNSGARIISMFPNHPIESSKIAQKFLTSLNAPVSLINVISTIVETHMWDITRLDTKNIRRFIAAVGQESIQNWFTVRYADAMSYNINNNHTKKLIDKFYQAVKNYLSQFSKDLEINKGKNLIIEGQ